MCQLPRFGRTNLGRYRGEISICKFIGCVIDLFERPRHPTRKYERHKCGHGQRNCCSQQQTPTLLVDPRIENGLGIRDSDDTEH